MPPLFKAKKKDGKKDGYDSKTPQETVREVKDEAPPPAYAAAPSNIESTLDPLPAASQDGQNSVDITASFSNLSLDANPKDPEVDTCLAHLKLLSALQALKEDVGYTDGLWNIWDSRTTLASDLVTRDNPPPSPPGVKPQKATLEDKRMLQLSKIREKRWALFVARAVDRYEAWWASLPQVMLREDDMAEGAPSAYNDFLNSKKYWAWTSDMLPPLDVLMVWHAHMLNPRDFLEDCLRHGLSSLWVTGIPWHLVAPAIDADSSYGVSDQAKRNWAAATGRDWSNVGDFEDTKLIKCPACATSLAVPWTTCGRDEKSDTTPGLVGEGYGDGGFSFQCTNCSLELNKKVLSVAKFIRDARLLTTKDTPMPGTVLDPVSGKPSAIPTDVQGSIYPRTFPNRMIKRKLMIHISDLINRGTGAPPDMDTIRQLIEKVTKDGLVIRQIEGHPAVGKGRLSIESRICIRKMMSHYWDNFSPFALDLAGAVMRQSIFTQKMHQIDWLHSPSCRETMARLITKYERFIAIMSANPRKTCVPTLDVDLAWHTHQLSPSAYYAFTTQETTKFTDHDDKIDEAKLSEAFEWTVKTYQELYSEVYSECTCWYCETIRAASTGTVSRLLGVCNQEKAAASFLTSGRAQLCPPDKSAHISAHNAVRMDPHSSITVTVDSYRQKRQLQQLEANYAKACKRALKKGRTLPPRNEYYDHWGYGYYMYSPFMYPLYFSPGLYYGGDPGSMSSGGAGWAACAAGSCGGGVAAGSCGGAGGCGSTSAGGLSGVASCGGGGGCGGGCGGGGGGGGGGCGGGGS